MHRIYRQVCSKGVPFIHILVASIPGQGNDHNMELGCELLKIQKNAEIEWAIFQQVIRLLDRIWQEQLVIKHPYCKAFKAKNATGSHAFRHIEHV